MRASKKYRIEVAKNLLLKCFFEIKNQKLYNWENHFFDIKPIFNFVKDINKYTSGTLYKAFKLKPKEIVISNKDPNPKVNGKGIKKIKEMGIKVVTNILKENFLINFKKYLIVVNEKINDKNIPTSTIKLNSIFSFNKSFIPIALAPAKAGIDK